jgi:hypothetical protein
MKTTLRWTLGMGLALASGLTGIGRAAAATSPETSSAITIHVRNYAAVAPQTLTEAEQVASGIFRKAGIETGWAHIVVTAENGHVNSADHLAYSLADIQLSILPREMSDRLGLPNNVMGVVPGTAPDRGIVYVLDSKVRTIFWSTLSAHSRGDMDRHISMGEVLGYAIAHEVGHLLLNQQVHSPHGIMRGEWSFLDFRDMACGMLLFTPQQAEFLRSDVRSRNTRQETSKLAELGYPPIAR